MRESRETLGIFSLWTVGRCDVSALIIKASHRTRYKLTLSSVGYLYIYLYIILHFVAVRDDSNLLSHLNTCKLAFKVQISKIWIFSYCYRFINS